MPTLDAAMAANRAAVASFLATARAVPVAAWTQPRAAGKWSPAQITVHVTLAYELSSRVLNGTWPGPSAPSLLRPVIRFAFLNPILRNGRFRPGGRSPAPFQPPLTSDPIGVLGARLESAARGVENDFAAAVRSGRTTLTHPFFGRVDLADYLALQGIHTNHHRMQLGAPGDG